MPFIALGQCRICPKRLSGHSTIEQSVTTVQQENDQSSVIVSVLEWNGSDGLLLKIDRPNRHYFIDLRLSGPAEPGA
jgi:hypothetical protein